MEVWLIYRNIKNADGKVEQIKSVEYCLTEKDAVKYSRLFDLQVPVDLRNKISHKYYVGELLQQ